MIYEVRKFWAAFDVLSELNPKELTSEEIQRVIWLRSRLDNLLIEWVGRTNYYKDDEEEDVQTSH